MNLIYWISTTLTAIYLTWSAYGYLFSDTVIEGIDHLGFPGFFRIQLAVLKIIAVLVLLIPQVPLLIKDWAYIGIGLFYLTAIIAHFAHRDPLLTNIVNFVLLGILIVSNIYLKKTMS